MVDSIDSVLPRTVRTLSLENACLELLLYDLLDELLYYKDSEGLLLRLEEITVTEGPEGYRLTGTAVGEEIDPSRHVQRVDVKAVTFHQFSLRKTDLGWKSRVILDV
jgi:SHS2 domain-containing protein